MKKYTAIPPLCSHATPSVERVKMPYFRQNSLPKSGKWLVFLFLLTLFSPSFGQSITAQKCDYATLYNQGAKAAKDSLFDKALLCFNSARRCDPSKGKEIDEAINRVFLGIQKQKKTAIDEKERAEKEKNRAVKNGQIAQSNALINKAISKFENTNQSFYLLKSAYQQNKDNESLSASLNKTFNERAFLWYGQGQLPPFHRDIYIDTSLTTMTWGNAADDCQLLMCGNDDKINLLDPKGKRIQSFLASELGDSAFQYCDLAPSGEWLALAVNKSGKIQIFMHNLLTEKHYWQPTFDLNNKIGYEKHIRGLVFSKDSKEIAIACADSIVVFNVEDKKRLNTMVVLDNKFKSALGRWEIEDPGPATKRIRTLYPGD